MLAAMLWGLAGCGSSQPVATTPAIPVLQPARHEQVTFESFDGTTIAATVYMPALAPGQTAPLILHGNGWNDSRAVQPSPLTRDPQQFYHDMHAGMVTRLWEAGYVVLSLDNRGWGDSGGQIQIMDPAYEVRDFSAAIDWAEAHLPILLHEGRAVVGGIGGSYGGGFQILLAAQDDRVKAISPWVTWHDLQHALAPSMNMRTVFTLLYVAGQLNGRLAPWVNLAYLEALAGLPPPATGPFARFREHGPVIACEQGQFPKVDALIVQGTTDILFDLTEGWRNYECFSAAGGDVRLLAVPNGHVITDLNLQAPPTSSTCGPVDPFESVVAWYDEKLRGIADAAASVPRVCIATADDDAWLGNTVPVGGTVFEMAPVIVSGPSLPIPQAAPDIFVPLTTLEAPMRLAGVPQATLELSGLPLFADATVFVGLGFRRDGTVHLVNDQLLPLRGLGPHHDALTAVGQNLEAGDEVGLALYASSAQYLATGSRLPFLVTLSGSVALPLSAR